MSQEEKLSEMILDPETLTMRKNGRWGEVPTVSLSREGRQIPIFGMVHYSPLPFGMR